MTTEEFYKRELATGHLGPKPPSGKAGEIGSRGMRDYVRGLANVTLGELGSGGGNGAKGRLVMPKWETKEQCIVLPAGPTSRYSAAASREGGAEGKSAARRLLRTDVVTGRAKATPNDRVADSRGNGDAPVPKKRWAHSNAGAEERLRVFAVGREVLPFTAELRDARVVHFAAFPKKGYRLLTHWYTFFYHDKLEVDRRMKRFVRDHFRYHDSIWCMANRVLQALERDVEANQWKHYVGGIRGAGVGAGDGAGVGVGDGGDGGGEVGHGGGRMATSGYAAYHIRHGDFQFKVVRLSAAEILESSKDLLLENELLYIASDEKDLSFFDDMCGEGSGHTCKFLNDYLDVAGLRDVDPNYYGMIDTIVASRARIFVGTW